MLDIIRSNAQSWGVKLAFGLIIIVFVFWGVGSFTGGSGTEVLSVNGQVISQAEIERTRYNMLQQLREQNPELSGEALEEAAKNYGLRQEAVRQLVMRALIQQEAERAGFSITPIELRKFVEGLPLFHNQDGKFDPQMYIEVLKAQGRTPGQFEKEVSADLLSAKLQEEVTTGVFVTNDQARDLLKFMSQSRTLEYIPFAFAEYTEKAMPADDAVQAWYDTNLGTYTIPAKADVEYLVIGAEQLAPNYPIDEATAAEYYEKNKDRYAQTEQVHARHILIMPQQGAADAAKADADAKVHIEEIHKRLLAGEDFAALAKEFSQDGSAASGGDLGWFEHEQMVPEFADAAFALQPGSISAPVKSQFGYHLIKSEGKKAAGVTPFEEVKASIAELLSKDQAAGKVQDALDQVLMAVIGGKDLSTSGEPFKLKVARSGSMSAEELSIKMGLKPAEAEALLTATPGVVKDTPYTTKDGYVLVKVVATTPSGRQPFDEVKGDIKAELTREAAQALAETDAKAALGAMKGQTLPEALLSRAKKIEGFTRQGFVPDIGALRPDQARALFDVEPGVWLNEPVTMGDSVALVRVTNVTAPADEEIAPLEDIFVQQMTQDKRNQMFGALIALLQSKADIQVKNPAGLTE